MSETTSGMIERQTTGKRPLDLRGAMRGFLVLGMAARMLPWTGALGLSIGAGMVERD